MRRRREPTVLAVLMLMLSVQGASGTPDGIEYSLGPQGFEVTAGVFALSLTDETGPHYNFYDRVENETEHHVMLLRAFEYVDDNQDGLYNAENDSVVNPSISFQTASWSFGGFLTQEDEGVAVGLQFNLSSVGGFAPHQTELRVVLQNQIQIHNQNALRFGFVVDGWNWAREDTNLAIVMALGTGDRGQQMRRPEITHQPKNITFENGFFAFDSPVFYGQNQAELNVSLGGAVSQGEGEQILLCVPYFGNNVLVCDTLIGLVQASSIPSTTQTTTTLLGTDRLLLVSVGVSVVIVVVALLQRKEE
ncbi:MAG: hypothetical protein EAX81_06620 [Candidatus Thorarchaeota archaeon]|nr:hypothetical protein [Candidatus Thorarchaeota archaeon]